MCPRKRPAVFEPLSGKENWTMKKRISKFVAVRYCMVRNRRGLLGALGLACIALSLSLAAVIVYPAEKADAQRLLNPTKWFTESSGLAIIRFERPEGSTLGGTVVANPEKLDISMLVFQRDKKGWIGQFGVFRWIKKPPDADEIGRDALVTKRLPPATWFSPPISVKHNDIALIEVSIKDGELWGGPLWLLKDITGDEVVRIEKAGLEQVEKLQSISDDKKRTGMYLEFSKSTKNASVLLAGEASNMIVPELADERRIELAEGLARIIAGEDTPDYVRNYASSSLTFLQFTSGDRDKLKKRDTVILSILLKAFHEYVERDGDDAWFESSVLSATWHPLERGVAVKESPDIIGEFTADLQKHKEFLLLRPTREREKRAAVLDSYLKIVQREQN